MNNWRLLLFAVVAVLQPIASFTEQNLFDGRQECCGHRSTRLQNVHGPNPKTIDENRHITELGYRRDERPDTRNRDASVVRSNERVFLERKERRVAPQLVSRLASGDRYIREQDRSQRNFRTDAKESRDSIRNDLRENDRTTRSSTNLDNFDNYRIRDSRHERRSLFGLTRDTRNVEEIRRSFNRDEMFSRRERTVARSDTRDDTRVTAPLTQSRQRFISNFRQDPTEDIRSSSRLMEGRESRQERGQVVRLHSSNGRLVDSRLERIERRQSRDQARDVRNTVEAARSVSRERMSVEKRDSRNFNENMRSRDDERVNIRVDERQYRPESRSSTYTSTENSRSRITEIRMVENRDERRRDLRDSAQRRMVRDRDGTERFSRVNPIRIENEPRKLEKYTRDVKAVRSRLESRDIESIDEQRRERDTRQLSRMMPDSLGRISRVLERVNDVRVVRKSFPESRPDERLHVRKQDREASKLSRSMQNSMERISRGLDRDSRDMGLGRSRSEFRIYDLSVKQKQERESRTNSRGLTNSIVRLSLVLDKDIRDIRTRNLDSRPNERRSISTERMFRYQDDNTRDVRIARSRSELRGDRRFSERSEERETRNTNIRSRDIRQMSRALEKNARDEDIRTELRNAVRSAELREERDARERILTTPESRDHADRRLEMRRTERNFQRERVQRIRTEIRENERNHYETRKEVRDSRVNTFEDTSRRTTEQRNTREIPAIRIVRARENIRSDQRTDERLEIRDNRRLVQERFGLERSIRDSYDRRQDIRPTSRLDRVARSLSEDRDIVRENVRTNDDERSARIFLNERSLSTRGYESDANSRESRNFRSERTMGRDIRIDSDRSFRNNKEVRDRETLRRKVQNSRAPVNRWSEKQERIREVRDTERRSRTNNMENETERRERRIRSNTNDVRKEGASRNLLQLKSRNDSTRLNDNSRLQANVEKNQDKLENTNAFNLRYVFYTMQAAYLCGILVQMLTENPKNTKARNSWWIGSSKNLIKVD